MNASNFVKASDIRPVSEAERTRQQLVMRHPRAYHVQKDRLWRCPDCGKQKRDAAKLAQRVCRRK